MALVLVLVLLVALVLVLVLVLALVEGRNLLSAAFPSPSPDERQTLQPPQLPLQQQTQQTLSTLILIAMALTTRWETGLTGTKGVRMGAVTWIQR